MKASEFDQNALKQANATANAVTIQRGLLSMLDMVNIINAYLGDKYLIVNRELPEDPGTRYTQGMYSRRNHEAMFDDMAERSCTK